MGRWLAMIAAVVVASQSVGALKSFDSGAQMCAATGLQKGATLEVKGYRTPDDGGGGTFRYDPASKAEPDGGAILEAKAGGRFVRVVDPEEDAYAEWFGAYGDGSHDDHEAINRCLAAYGRVKLRAKVYGVRGVPEKWNPKASFRAIDLGPHYRIEGSGRDKTTLRLIDGTNPPGGGPGDNYFIMLANRDFYESAEYIVVRDMTIDCNFDKQDKNTTIHAIGIRGGGALVERVNFRGYGTGRHPETGASRECFVVHQTLVYKDATSCRQAAVYRDLDFTGCGHNGVSAAAGTVGEITHIALGGADNYEDKGWIMPKGKDPDFDPANGGENEKNWWPSYGGLVEGCVIHDEIYDPATQKSPLNGITYGDCIGLTIKDNVVRNWEGTAVFTMSWWNKDTVIVDNKFLGVMCGVALNMASEGAKPIQCPLHDGVLIAHNEIELGSPAHAPWRTFGVSLFGGDFPATVRMKSVHVLENTIRGRAYTNPAGAKVCPMGIKIQILRACYHDIRIEDNVIDVPDYSETVWVPQEAGSLSLFFYPQALWESGVKAGDVVYRGNRDKTGKVLYPALADWYMTNKPVWGKTSE